MNWALEMVVCLETFLAGGLVVKSDVTVERWVAPKVVEKAVVWVEEKAAEWAAWKVASLVALRAV